jgi:hypothetical protein
MPSRRRSIKADALPAPSRTTADAETRPCICRSAAACTARPSVFPGAVSASTTVRKASGLSCAAAKLRTCLTKSACAGSDMVRCTTRQKHGPRLKREKSSDTTWIDDCTPPHSSKCRRVRLGSAISRATQSPNCAARQPADNEPCVCSVGAPARGPPGWRGSTTWSPALATRGAPETDGFARLQRRSPGPGPGVLGPLALSSAVRHAPRAFTPENALADGSPQHRHRNRALSV